MGLVLRASFMFLAIVFAIHAGPVQAETCHEPVPEVTGMIVIPRIANLPECLTAHLRDAALSVMLRVISYRGWCHSCELSTSAVSDLAEEHRGVATTIRIGFSESNE